MMVSAILPHGKVHHIGRHVTRNYEIGHTCCGTLRDIQLIAFMWAHIIKRPILTPSNSLLEKQHPTLPASLLQLLPMSGLFMEVQ
jgi:hypothetical protein